MNKDKAYRLFGYYWLVQLFLTIFFKHQQWFRVFIIAAPLILLSLFVYKAWNSWGKKDWWHQLVYIGVLTFNFWCIIIERF